MNKHGNGMCREDTLNKKCYIRCISGNNSTAKEKRQTRNILVGSSSLQLESWRAGVM